jgi:hypothetical protein
MFSSGIFSMKRGLHTDTCVIAGTKIRCWNGYKNIEDIKEGDKVWTHQARCRKVSKTMNRFVNEDVIVLSLDNKEEIVLTSNHPILTKKGWIAAGELTCDDILMKIEYESKLKGKTYEQIYGVERAIELKAEKFKNLDRSIGHISEKKGKTYEQIYGFERSLKIKSKFKHKEWLKRRKISHCKCGKSYEVIQSSKRKYCSLECYWRYSGCGNNFRSKVGNFKLHKNPNWQGGLSFEPYPIEFNSDLKKKILERDNCKCVLCGSNKVLQIHHIDYNKDNNIDENLVALCRSCHYKTNNKRLEWMEFFINNTISNYIAIHNGTKISNIEHKHYEGLVYNLEVKGDHSYAGKGIIFHNCVIIDDILGTVDNPMVLTELEKAERMFNQEVMNIPNPGCPLIVYGTAIDYSDLLFKLKENPEFLSIWLPAIDPDKDHEILWESRFNREWLESRKRSSGWKSFASEFLLMPVLSADSFFTREDLDKCIEKNLKNYSLYSVFDKKDKHVVAGLDIGKRRNPSHLAIFVDDNNDNLVQIHQSFWDGIDYTEQIERIKTAVENFGIDKLYIDATRSEMEERGLPRECIMIKFSGRGERSQATFANDFAKRVEGVKLRLIDDDRFISQILCMNNSLKAPVTSFGHADSFWSVALAIGAYQDFYSTNRSRRFSYMGNLQEQFVDHSPADIKNQAGICPVCKARSIINIEGGQKCENCFSKFEGGINERAANDKSKSDIEKFLKGGTFLQ